VTLAPVLVETGPALLTSLLVATVLLLQDAQAGIPLDKTPPSTGMHMATRQLVVAPLLRPLAALAMGSGVTGSILLDHRTHASSESCLA